MSNLVAVIMAGGSGTRFWPLSTPETPKQFLRLLGERTMLQLTYDRLEGLVPADRVIVVTNDRFVQTVRRQLPEVPAKNVIGEPMGRDTAAAITLTAVVCGRLFGDVTMLVLPADHVISPVSEFQRAVRAAVAAVASGRRLYTFGIPPTHPATGYGYLRAGELVDRLGGVDHYRLASFKEKPSLEIAQEYVQSGEYFWNSGMFVWKVEVLLSEIRKHLPDHARLLLPLGETLGQRNWRTRLADALEQVPAISIDYGVMEKTSQGYMVKAPFSWNDVGSWNALREYLDRDRAGNVYRGIVKALEAEENLVFCEDADEVVALVGVKDLVVARVGGRTLIVHREKVEELRNLLRHL